MSMGTSKFLATCISVPVDREPAFLVDFGEAAMPALRVLQDEGRIAGHHMFEQRYSIAEDDLLPAWQFLQMVRLPRGNDGQSDDTVGRIMTLNDDLTGATVHHVELAETVPNVDLAVPADDSPYSSTDVNYKIEYIQVHDSFRADYRHIIETWDGPMKTRLIDQGFMYNFIGLETDTVIRTSADTVAWNVMHIMGLDDPDKAKQLPEVFDVTLKSMDKNTDYASVFGDLPSMRVKLRHIIGRSLPGLTLE